MPWALTEVSTGRYGRYLPQAWIESAAYQVVPILGATPAACLAGCWYS